MMNEHIKKLLSINNNAFRFLHSAEGFDFEKPYFITEQAGRFTVNTVTKAVNDELNPAQCKIALFIVPARDSCKSGLYYATLNRGKFDGTKKKGVSYWGYHAKDRAGNIEYCWGVGDFEKMRKAGPETVFIIAQGKEHTAAPEKRTIDLLERFALVDARKRGDGRGNHYIGALELRTTDGSNARFEYEPYNTYYGNETRSADLADHIDKSGYLLRPRRLDLMRRARQLRADRKKTEADNADYSRTTAVLQALIDETRSILSGAVMSCTDSNEARELSDRLSSFSRALSWFDTYKSKLSMKKYESTARIESDIDDIKKKLNYCATGEKGGAIS